MDQNLEGWRLWFAEDEQRQEWGSLTPELDPAVCWCYCPVPVSSSSLHCCNDAVNLGQDEDKRKEFPVYQSVPLLCLT